MQANPKKRQASKDVLTQRAPKKHTPMTKEQTDAKNQVKMQANGEAMKNQLGRMTVEQSETGTIPLLTPFDRNKIKLDSFIIVVGKRRYGKTTWTQDILSEIWPAFHRGGYVFTKTKHNWFWQQHFPDSRIYPGFDAEVVGKLLDEQKAVWDEFRYGVVSPDTIPYICMIFDDVISDKTLRYEALLNELVYSGRHFNVFIVVCTQVCKR